MSSSYDHESNRYFVKHWRNIPESTVDAMDGFLSWLELDSSSPDISGDELEEIKKLVNAYLGRNTKKVVLGENELLQAWISSSRPD